TPTDSARSTASPLSPLDDTSRRRPQQLKASRSPFRSLHPTPFVPATLLHPPPP
ncbi:hypothetical protein T484DRAFT_1989359, partial [Baffinella frigidus]